MIGVSRGARGGAFVCGAAAAGMIGWASPAEAVMQELSFELVITGAEAVPIAPWLTPDNPEYDPEGHPEDIAEIEAVGDVVGTVFPASFIFESAFFAAPPAPGEARIELLGTPLTIGDPPEDGVTTSAPGTDGRIGMANDLVLDGGGALDVVAFLIDRPYVGPGPDDAPDEFAVLFAGDSAWFEEEADIAESLRSSLTGDGSGRVQQALFDARIVQRSSSESGEVTLWDEMLFGEVVGGSVAFRTLGISESAPLLPDAPTEAGVSTFVLSAEDIVASVDESGRLWIDPEIAVGYDYAVEGGLFAGVTAPSFEVVPDTDGYELVIGDSIFALGVGASLDFADLGFGGGVSAFSILGIDEALMLDPDDPLAFALGVSFVDGSVTEGVSITQTARTVEVGAVPLPATAWLLAAGLGGLGWRAARRRG